MNETVIIFCVFVLCAGLSCGQAAWVYRTVHKPEMFYAASIFQRLIFTSPECICLNSMVVPTFCATFPHSHSILQHRELTFSSPPVSSSSPLVVCPDYLHVQKPIKTYSKLSIMTSKTLWSTEPSIPLGRVNENACGGELGSVSLQSSSP